MTGKEKGPTWVNGAHESQINKQNSPSLSVQQDWISPPKYEMESCVRHIRNTRTKRTDLGNAQLFAELFRRDIRFCHAHGAWFYWDGLLWREDSSGEMIRYAKRFNQALLEAAKIEEVEEIQKEQLKWVLASQSRNRIESMMKLATAQCGIPISPHEFNADPMLFCVENGTLDLRDGNFRKPERWDYITKRARVRFEHGADCHRWKEFIRQICCDDEQLARYLQKIAGLLLTGKTDEQCFFVFYGGSANGKSVFVKVIQHLLGDYCRTTPPETFMEKRNAGGPSPDLARLMGARGVFASEASDRGVLSEETIKRVTGQDAIVCRRLHMDYFEYYPQFKYILVTNHKPTIRGQDNAIWRRVRLVPFKTTIPSDKQDRHLFEKLQSESSGILNWALEGLRMYLLDGLDPPECVATATLEYRSEMDIIGDWFEECCELDADARVLMKDAYVSYNMWCKESGHFPFSKKNFGIRLREQGISEAKSGSNRYYLGFRIWSTDCGSRTEQVILDFKRNG